jgi:hypothetical protein
MDKVIVKEVKKGRLKEREDKQLKKIINLGIAID